MVDEDLEAEADEHHSAADLRRLAEAGAGGGAEEHSGIREEGGGDPDGRAGDQERDSEQREGDPGGLIVTILLGIAGALVGGYLGRAMGWYGPEEPAGFIVATLGAILLLAIYRMAVKRPA